MNKLCCFNQCDTSGTMTSNEPLVLVFSLVLEVWAREQFHRSNILFLRVRKTQKLLETAYFKTRNTNSSSQDY